jgi:hypothetical protein
MKMVDCKTSKKNAKFKITSDVSFKHIQNGEQVFKIDQASSLIPRVSYGTGPNDSKPIFVI